MYLGIIAIEALVILGLLYVLLWGQSAAITSERAQLAQYRATVQAMPSITPRPCRQPPYYTPTTC